MKLCILKNCEHCIYSVFTKKFHCEKLDYIEVDEDTECFEDENEE